MDLNAEMIKLVVSQGIFAVLFVYMLLTERKDNKERENKLMAQLEKSNDVYTNVIDAINALKETILKQK
jgi:preprotein translocase subunit YajC